MKPFWRTVPLLLLSSSPATILGDDDGGRGYYYDDRQRRRRQRRQRQEEKERSSSSSSAHYKKKFEEYFGEKRQAGTEPFFGPRHIWEGISNTLRVGAPILLVGTASVVGFPALGLFSNMDKMEDRRRKKERRRRGGSDGDGGTEEAEGGGGKLAKRAGLVIAAAIAGGLIGGFCWLAGLVYAAWQIAVGAVRTPKTLWSWLARGELHWKDGAWRVYNLTGHAEELEADRFFGGDGASAADDSLYKLLGVDPTATSREIKRAYYQLAKQLHPDKNPDREDEFRAVHSAYETLYNDESRKLYDEWGADGSSSNGGGGKLPVDPAIFFDVLFGVSPELESWIGDLGIKRFANDVVRLAWLAMNSDNSDSIDQEKMLEAFARIFLDRTNQRESRQVEIALFVREFTERYVRGEIGEAEYRALCDEQASLVSESTPFPVVFLEAIGSVLYWQGKGGTLPPPTPIDIPFAIMAFAKDKGSGFGNAGWFSYRFVRLVREFMDRSERTDTAVREKYENGWGQNNWRKSAAPKEEDIAKEVYGRVFRDMVPKMLDYVWRYNHRDIVKTLRGACWKLLHDTDTRKSWKRRRRQSKALVLLGKSFLKVAKTKKRECGGGSTETDGEGRKTNGNGASGFFMNDADRLEVAIHMAMARESSNKNSAVKESEELLREHKKAKEEEKRQREEEGKRKRAREEARQKRREQQDQRQRTRDN